jgi:hypothetical protein
MTTEPVSQSASVRPLALVIGLALMALVLAQVAWRLHPPVPKSAEAPADEFSAGRAMTVVQKLLAEGVAHPLGSTNNDRVRERIIDYLKAAGYEPTVQDTLVTRFWSGTSAACAQVNNVVTQLPGQRDGPAVLLAG